MNYGAMGKSAMVWIAAFLLSNFIASCQQVPDTEPVTTAEVTEEGVSGQPSNENQQAGADFQREFQPSDPPRADRISFGPLNDLGESVVTGAPGAVFPSANVLLVNLNSSHQDYVISEPDGSFESKIFAPPGSSIMVKHGPDHRFWETSEQGANQIGLTVFPATTIYRPAPETGASNALPFAAAGGIGIDDAAIPTSIEAGWSLSGTVSPVDELQPGDVIQLDATIRLYSQAISNSSDVSAIDFLVPEVRWLMLYDKDGKPLPYVNQTGSGRLTPTGFPILDSRRPEITSPIEFERVDWQFKGGHTLEAPLSLTLTLDPELPEGIYRPVLTLQFAGVPAGSEWRAALLSWMAGQPHFAGDSLGAGLPLLNVGMPSDGAESEASHRVIWHLLMDNAVLGTRGTGAFEDRDIFQPSSFVATQGARYVLPPVDAYSGEQASYRLEPYLPMISYGRGAAPGPPLIPFKLPGGELCVTVHAPDSEPIDLGCDSFAQSVNGDRSTAEGEVLNLGAIEVSEVYGLTTASDQFVYSFEKAGYHAVEMHGWLEDIWGNRYEGGGTYEVWAAEPLDIDFGLLPGTPLAAGDPVNPAIQLNPRLPAHVDLSIEHVPFSDPDRSQTHFVEGFANRFGYFAPQGEPITLDEPGEYRLDLFVEYLNPETGEAYAGSATWGGVVMTPHDEAQLVAHGRRGSDNVLQIPNQWFVFCELDLLEGATPHLLNPYQHGDILWTHINLESRGECQGDALMMSASVQDTAGDVEEAITERFNRGFYFLHFPGNFEERAQADALPLFSTTTSARPVSLFPEETDQIAYAYLSSQRPGVRVRESVAEDVQGSGYWRINGMYDNQPSVGLEGDLPNDFKFQFVGAVYRDLVSGLSEYLGQGSGWVHLPDGDSTGSRVMPPFSGPGNGGWTTAGGPLMTLKGQDIHMFIFPTGVRPGSVLQLGDSFVFAGHIMPTLDSRVQVEVISPSGESQIVDGQANRIGYFYDPQDNFIVEEPGVWTAAVRVWHDGQIGSGEQVNCDPADPFSSSRPCPSGDVLGSVEGRFSFYVVPAEAPRLTLAEPKPGRLEFGEEVTPIELFGPVPEGLENAAVNYTISMPGFILQEGQAHVEGGQFSILFDPAALHNDFPNLDLTGRHAWESGLADTFSFGIFLTGEMDGEVVYQATTLTIQGDLVYVETH